MRVGTNCRTDFGLVVILLGCVKCPVACCEGVVDWFGFGYTACTEDVAGSLE